MIAHVVTSSATKSIFDWVLKYFKQNIYSEWLHYTKFYKTILSAQKFNFTVCYRKKYLMYSTKLRICKNVPLKPKKYAESFSKVNTNQIPMSIPNVLRKFKINELSLCWVPFKSNDNYCIAFQSTVCKPSITLRFFFRISHYFPLIALWNCINQRHWEFQNIRQRKSLKFLFWGWFSLKLIPSVLVKNSISNLSMPQLKYYLPHIECHSRIWWFYNFLTGNFIWI